jgi:hypothetical protein
MKKLGLDTIALFIFSGVLLCGVGSFMFLLADVEHKDRVQAAKKIVKESPELQDVFNAISQDKRIDAEELRMLELCQKTLIQKAQ